MERVCEGFEGSSTVARSEYWRSGRAWMPLGCWFFCGIWGSLRSGCCCNEKEKLRSRLSRALIVFFPPHTPGSQRAAFGGDWSLGKNQQSKAQVLLPPVRPREQGHRRACVGRIHNYRAESMRRIVRPQPDETLDEDSLRRVLVDEDRRIEWAAPLHSAAAGDVHQFLRCIDTDYCSRQVAGSES
ncbi:hypothetical protein DFH27DRAFT_41032 [Peziza echinospora]|nr:hypothetical protein DFH27DRAFT_41032 [Peziza echinospora]